MDLYWIKFPKVGSGFAATIIGFACDAQTKVSTPGGIVVPSHCNRTRLQEVLAPPHHNVPRWFETPVIWKRDTPSHKVVALFRDPYERRRSELYYFQERLRKNSINCCGFIPPKLKLLVLPILQSNETMADKLSAYLKFAASYQGCMTNMLLGAGCFAGTPTGTMVRRATRMVEQELEFVGLQGRWNDTVRLWHARFGGVVFANEMTQHTTKTQQLQDTSTRTRDADNPVVDAATRRFSRELSSYHATTLPSRCESSRFSTDAPSRRHASVRS